MSVFVTGASGFLGGRLAQILHERGEEVVVLARRTSSLGHLEGLKLRVIEGSMTDTDVLKLALQDVTQVYHCAACSTDWAPLATYTEANVTGTQNLLAASLSAPRLERFLHVSTTDVYGYPRTPCTEDHAIADAGLPYNQTKGLAEQAVWRSYREGGLPVTIVRPATIYGPRGKDFVVEIAAMLRQRMMATIDRGEAPGGFIFVDDVVEGILAACTSRNALGQVYNLSGGSGATWAQYLSMFARLLGTSPPWIDLSMANAMRAAKLFEAVHRGLKLPGRPLLTRHAVQLLGVDQEFPIAKARSDLGFHPLISVEEGLGRSVAWLSNAGLSGSL